MSNFTGEVTLVSIRKKVSLLTMSFLMILGVVYSFDSDAKAEDVDPIALNNSDSQFVVMDREGNVEYVDYQYDDTVVTEPETFQVASIIGDNTNVLGEYDSYEEAEEVLESQKRKRSVGEPVIMANDSVVRANYGVVILRNKVINYKEVETGRSGYLHGGSGADAVYISTINGSTVRIKIAGVIADVALSDVLKIETYASNTQTSYYDVYNGILYHNTMYWNGASIAMSAARVGVQGMYPDYLEDGGEYYSYDGHYFYSTYQSMIDDYREGSSARAINASKPYYNYYQYLSHHTTTNFSIEQINVFFNGGINNRESVLKNQAKNFVDVQNTYTVNAGLMFGVSINESAWGTSNFAKQRKNLFGHNAVDSNPGQATYYKDQLESIIEHAFGYISYGYLDAVDYRYRGPHLGDKNSGMNVKYASDQYWGEKAASHLYKLTTDSGNKSDYLKYKIGIMKTGDQPFYKEANPNSRQLYSSGVNDNSGDQVYDFPVTILETVKGTDGKDWFKIISDTPLTGDRNGIHSIAVFQANRDYVFIPASSVNVVGGDFQESQPDIPDQTPETPVLPGDVNGDGKVTSSDYVLIKNHILDKNKLSDTALKVADVNKDGKVTSSDYVLVKNYILGKIDSLG